MTTAAQLASQAEEALAAGDWETFSDALSQREAFEGCGCRIS